MEFVYFRNGNSCCCPNWTGTCLWWLARTFWSTFSRGYYSWSWPGTPRWRAPRRSPCCTSPTRTSPWPASRPRCSPWPPSSPRSALAWSPLTCCWSGTRPRPSPSPGLSPASHPWSVCWAAWAGWPPPSAPWCWRPWPTSRLWWRPRSRPAQPPLTTPRPPPQLGCCPLFPRPQ